MYSPIGHPIVLIHQFEIRSNEKWEQIRAEYWGPTKGWDLLEHLAEEMLIIEEIPITISLSFSSYMKGHCDYMSDSDMARCLYI